MTIPRDPAQPDEKVAPIPTEAWQSWGTPKEVTGDGTGTPLPPIEENHPHIHSYPTSEPLPTATQIAVGDETILHEADRIINGPRNGAYGNATPAFTQYAQMWSIILGVPVTAKQVALCMAGLKICRETVKPQRDNRVDACGYLGLADQIETGTK